MADQKKTNVNVSAGVTPVEGGATGAFMVALDTPAPAGGLTVNYTLSGTANLSTDYTVTAGSNITAVTGSSFTIAAGQTTAVLAVNAAADAVSDPNETVDLKLTAGTDYQLVQAFVPTFAPKVDYETGNGAYSVQVADFNADGKTDLVVAHSDSNIVSVLLRNAANTGFDAKVDFSTGSKHSSISVGDFNNDGKADLAVVNNDNTVSVLLRNAANTGFDTKVDYATGGSVRSSVSGDFNNDGKADLALANDSNNSVSVLLRNASNNGFDPGVDYTIGNSPNAVSAGDFNGDGKIDLAVVNSNQVSVLLRNADNTGFDAKVDYPTGTSPSSISVGDFNNDGKLDLAVANYDDNAISVLLRNAANTGFDAKVDYATGLHPWSVSTGDFNNDGKVDLAIAYHDSDTVSLLLRNAANTGFDAKVDYATGGSLGSLVSAADFNNDGKLDLAAASIGSTKVAVLLNNSNSNNTATLTIADTTSNNIAPSNVIKGTHGNDTLPGTAVDDGINGGFGFDTLRESGVLTDYAISQIGMSVVLTNNQTGTRDVLTDIERVTFDSGNNLTIAYTQAEVVARHLMTHWLHRDLSVDEGAYVLQHLTHSSDTEIANLFLTLPEASGLANKSAAELLAGYTEAEAVAQHLMTHWLHRDLSVDEGAYVRQHLTQSSATDIANVFLTLPEAAGLANKSAAELLAGYESDPLMQRLSAERELTGGDSNEQGTLPFGIAVNIDGGKGYDVLHLLENRNDVNIAVNDNILELTRNTDGAMLDLKNAEMITFTDGNTVAIAHDPIEGILGRLVHTFFDRNATVDEWRSGGEALAQHIAPDDILKWFQDNAHLNGLSDSDYIQTLYQNTFDRAATATEQNNYLTQLHDGSLDRSWLAVDLAQSPEAVTALGSQVVLDFWM